MVKSKSSHQNKRHNGKSPLYTKRPYTPEFNTYIDITAKHTPCAVQTTRCQISYIEGDVLEAEETTMAHAVAADLKCSAGLARQVKDKLGAPVWEIADKPQPGDVIPTQSGDKTILNVITKHQSAHKLHQNPNQFLVNFKRGIAGLHQYCKANNLNQLAIPRIGCGLD
jgi:O-acetyl-ADP-ribose deacetylase (regulator of RNase III)